MGKDFDINQVRCKRCGSSRMRRLPREGFLQRNVLNSFGYYPWECPVCRETQFFRLRGKREHRTNEWDEGAATEMRVSE